MVDDDTFCEDVYATPNPEIALLKEENEKLREQYYTANKLNNELLKIHDDRTEKIVYALAILDNLLLDETAASLCRADLIRLRFTLSSKEYKEITK